MNGIKLGEDMTEGCVIINGVRKVIQEIKTKAGVIWPISHAYTHTLDNLSLHYYPSGTMLNPNRSNYAYLMADYKTWEGSTLISTQRVQCSPVYSISPTYLEPIVTEGDFMYWDKAQYGKTNKSQDYVNAKGSYAGLTTDSTVRVDLATNTFTSTYVYEKDFSLDHTGDIPAAGATYNFTASSYRTETRHWTSGEIETLSRTTTASTLSSDPDTVTFSQTIIVGEVTGTVTFPRNLVAIRESYTIKLYNSPSGTSEYRFVQAAASNYYITLVPTGREVAAAGGSTTFRIDTNYPNISVSPPPPDDNWYRVSRVEDNVSLYVNQNTGLRRSSTIAVRGYVSSSQSESAYFTLTQLAGEQPTTGVAIDLMEMWMRDASLDIDGWVAFKSQAHKGVQNSKDVAKITVTGIASLDIYIRSDHEGMEANYDYTIASTVNAPEVPKAYYEPTVKETTRGEQSSGTTLNDYKLVQYTGLTDNDFIYVVYSKDVSDSPSAPGTDEGYVLLPDGTTWINPYQ